MKKRRGLWKRILSLKKSKPDSFPQDPRFPHKQASGQKAETFTQEVLQKRGYKIIHKNLSDKQGEIDLIVQHKGYRGIIVVEIRSCAENSWMRLEDIFSEAKQEQVIRTSKRILTRHQLLQPLMNLRFDAVLVTFDRLGNPARFEHFPNAFEAKEEWF